MAVYLGLGKPDADELADYPRKESTWLGRWATPVAGAGGSGAIFTGLDGHWIGCAFGIALFAIGSMLTIFDSRRRGQH